MKSLFLTLAIVTTISTFAQNNHNDFIDFDSEKYDKKYFLIGTLFEYLGYRRTFTDSKLDQRIDKTQYSGELKYFLFIKSLFNDDYSDITIENNRGDITMYSPTLSPEIDDFYIYRAARIQTNNGVTFYIGHVNMEKIETEKQKLSFLLGIYLRYGLLGIRTKSSIEDYIQWLKKSDFLDENDKYKNFENITNAISMSNAGFKTIFFIDLLKYYECKNVELVNTVTFPVMHVVFFAPSEKIQEVINEAERLNRQIQTIDTNKVNFTKDGPKYFLVGK